ncbi:MAG: PAS domain S-box protein [Methanomassiliicoccales archaeon]|nr:PAS domain S-box protein [Methanomassiliicoccales archaeon]
MVSLQKLDFQSIVENAQELIVQIDPSAKVQYSNPACKSILGYEPSEIVGMSLSELVAPESLKEVLGYLKDRMEGRDAPKQYRLTAITKTGEKRRIDARTSALLENGQFQCVQAIIRDVTEEEELQAKVRAEMERFSDFIERSPSIIIGVDNHYRITTFNSGAQKTLGYSKEEMLGSSMLETNLVDAMNMASMKNVDYEKMAPMIRSSDSTAVTKTGKKLRIVWSTSTVSDNEGRMTGVIGIGHDITAKEELSELLLAQNRLLAVQTDIGYLTSSGPEPKLLMEKGLALLSSHFAFKRGMALQVLPKGETRLVASIGEPALEGEDLISKRLAQMAMAAQEPLFLPEDVAGTEYEDALGAKKYGVIIPLKGRSQVVGVMCLCSDQPFIDQEETSALVYAGSLFGFAFENALLSEAVRRSKDLQELFNDILLHDILNYMTPIHSYLECLSRKNLSIEKRSAYLMKMTGANARLENFIHDVGVLARAAEGAERALIATSLSVSVRSAISTAQARYSNAKITFQENEVDAKGPLHVLADEALPEIFSNLITNAVKFSSPKPVRVRVSMDQKRHLARVEVEDEGPGIPDDKKWKVFERHFSESSGKASKSTGLGLSIVRALAERYHGKVWADDRVKGDHSQGAKFVVELPLV